jgi:hypothetical protein
MLCMPPACWTVQGEVRGHRQQVESYLSAHLGTLPKSVGLPGTALRMLQAAAAAPLHGPLDLVRLALQLQASTLSSLPSQRRGCSRVRACGCSCAYWRIGWRA